jgi:hypothetical protein
MRISQQLAALLGAVLLCGPAGAALGAAAEKAAPPAIDPEAFGVAQRAGEYLRDHDRFSFTATTAYEVVQKDGEKLEFGATRRYLVQRPDRVRVEVDPRSGPESLVVFDGDQLTWAEPSLDVYAKLQLKQHRPIDEAVALLRDVLDVPVPLGELLGSDPRADLVGSLTGAYLVGTEKIAGVECDHVVLRNPGRDVQLWIARGDAPLLRRVVLTYRDEKGAPTFAANLDDWLLNATPPDDAFRYVPPAGAQRIRFALPAKAKPAAPTSAKEAR